MCTRIRDHKPVVKERYCPECGHTVSQRTVDMALFDYKCCGCHRARLSEFKPIIRWDIKQDGND